MPVDRKKAQKIGLRFSETMSGYLAEDVKEFEDPVTASARKGTDAASGSPKM